MSKITIQRILDRFEPQTAGIDSAEKGFGLLREFVSALACDLAESTFLSVQTTPGMVQETAQALADERMFSLGLIVTELVHRVGGTLNMSLTLTDVAADAFGARLVELSSAHRSGGVA